MNSTGIRVIAVGRFADPVPRLAPRLAALGVAPVRCTDVAGLPADLSIGDVLLSDVLWLGELPEAERRELSRRASSAGAWVAVCGGRERFREQVAWQRLGVGDIFPSPLDPDRLAAVVEDIHDRTAGPAVRVILLDDDQASLAAHAAMLRAAGVDVVEIADPLLALDAIEERPVDVLVVDIQMPGCLGTEFLTVVRQRPEYAELPAIYLTAYNDAARQLQARKTLMDDFLAKPVAPDVFVAAVKGQAWRHRRRTRAEALRRAKEAEGRRRLEQLRYAMDQHAIISVANAQGDIIDVNENFCRVSGYSRAELLGSNHRVVKSGIHPPEFYAELWRTISSGRVWNGEVCNRRKDGELYWVSASIAPFRDATGAVVEYISVRTDITELKRTASDLGEAQALAKVGGWESDPDSGGVRCSDEVYRIFGVDTTEFAPTVEAFLSRAHPDDRERLRASLGRAAGDGRLDVECRIVRPDGDVRHVHVLARLAVDARDNRRLKGTVQDITERRQAEARINLFQRIFDASEQCMAVADADGRVQFINAAYTRTMGYAKEDIIGRDFRFYAARDETRTEIHRAVVVERRPWTGLTNRRRKDGSEFVAYNHYGLIEDASGNLQAIFVLFNDFTEELLQREALKGAVAEAERANQAKSDFLSSMSHELRTPMNAIIGFAQMLEYDGDLDEDERDNVNEILKAGRHLLELINEVLDLAKIESGRIDLSMETVDVAAVSADCRDLVAPLLAPRRLTLTIDVPVEVQVRADRVRLKQVLLNLLSNAAKYNRDDGRIAVDVRAGAEGTVRIVVADTGRGISEAGLATLFQPFNRLDAEHGEIEGTGIGLTITRRLVETMGGKIGVDSRVGEGSVFWVELPAASVDPAFVEASDATAPTETRAAGRLHTVLCVDDNPANLKLMAQMLGRRPHIRLLTAQLPELAIELALAHRPDLVLLDINMPGMNGYQVLEIFRAEPTLRAVPVVAVTANAMPRDVDRGRAAGFTDYLVKPLDVPRLLDTVDRLLASTAKKEDS